MARARSFRPYKLSFPKPVRDELARVFEELRIYGKSQTFEDKTSHRMNFVIPARDRDKMWFGWEKRTKDRFIVLKPGKRLCKDEKGRYYFM